MDEERERLFSRLATIPGVRPMPSIGAWVLLKVERPSELARKINRRLSPGTVSVPRHVPGAIRVPVRDPKTNESLFQCLRELQLIHADNREAEQLQESVEETVEDIKRAAF